MLQGTQYKRSPKQFHSRKWVSVRERLDLALRRHSLGAIALLLDETHAHCCPVCGADTSCRNFGFLRLPRGLHKFTIHGTVRKYIELSYLATRFAGGGSNDRNGSERRLRGDDRNTLELRHMSASGVEGGGQYICPPPRLSRAKSGLAQLLATVPCQLSFIQHPASRCDALKL